MGLENGDWELGRRLSAIRCPLTASLMPAVPYAAGTEILRWRLRMTVSGGKVSSAITAADRRHIYSLPRSGNTTTLGLEGPVKP